MELSEEGVGAPPSVTGEHALYHKKKRVIKGLLRTSFASIGVYDLLNHKMIYSQWRILRKLGYEPSEYQEVSRNFFRKIVHPSDIRTVENHLRKLKTAQPGQVFNCLIRLKNKEGKYSWIAIRDTALHVNKEGEVSEVIGYLTDVSRYKSTKKKVKRNAETMRRLSYSTSHDLRAPVATMLGLLTLIKYELQAKDFRQEIIDSLEKTIVKMDYVIREFARSLDSASRKHHDAE